MVVKEIDSYKIVYYSDRYDVVGQPGIAYATKNHVSFSCFYNGNHVGGLIFLDKLEQVKNSYVNGKIILFYHLNLFNDVYNFIRYEKPLFIYLDSTNWNGFLGTTDMEPAGEED
jgi:hypothetical protein